MTIRRLLLAAAVGAASIAVAAPMASADLGCAWVDPYGVCISDPTGNVPDIPGIHVPSVPKIKVPTLP